LQTRLKPQKPNHEQGERKEVEIEMTYAGGIDKQSREDKLALTSRRVVAVSVGIRSILIRRM
jgi:hypothetical protein